VEATLTNPTVRSRIDAGTVSWTQILIFFIVFMLNVVDGLDVVAMSVSMPALTESWGLLPTDKGYILSSALVGMTLGAIFLAPYADVYGRRNIILWATILIGVSMLITGLIPPSVELMMLLRCISGLGIGIIFANGAAIGTEFAPDKYRNLVVTLVVMGYPFGAMLVGPIANIVIPAQGWEMLFIYGGIFTLIMTMIIYLYLPESVEFIAVRKKNTEQRLDEINIILRNIKCERLHSLHPSQISSEVSNQPKQAPVKKLFSNDLGIPTVCVWTIYFCGFLSLYFLITWIPTLFVNSGFDISSGIAALTLFNLGAVIGIAFIGLITTRIKLAKPISLYFFGSSVFLVSLYYYEPRSIFWLNILIFTIGFLLQGGFAAMYALAARIYPTSARATGIGWAAGLGRTGAIVSPILAGYLVADNWNMYDLFLLFSIPLCIASFIVFWFKD
jgi:AAHS family 4-hydroxybenzoate transporter-like MFS transporter